MWGFMWPKVEQSSRTPPPHPVEIEEARRDASVSAYIEGFCAAERNHAQAKLDLKNMERYLWAAVMSNGGKLDVSPLNLAAYDRGDYVSLKVYDPTTRNDVLIARTKPRAATEAGDK